MSTAILSGSLVGFFISIEARRPTARLFSGLGNVEQELTRGSWKTRQAFRRKVYASPRIPSPCQRHSAGNKFLAPPASARCTSWFNNIWFSDQDGCRSCCDVTCLRPVG